MPCQMGLCQGFLPGCSKGNDKSLYVPSMTFNFNRPFHFHNGSQGRFSGLMQHALAYAFSTLPESIDIMIKEWNSTASGSHHSVSRTTTSGPGDWWSGRPSQTSPPSVEQPTPSPAAKEDSALTNAFKKWWSGATGRRLQAEPGSQRSSLQVGDHDDVSGTLGRHQVRIRFVEGVPFVIDRPLIEMMMQNGYFDLDVQDDASGESPLEITGFSIDSGFPQGARALAAKRVAPPCCTALATAAALCGVATVLVLRARRETRGECPRGAPESFGLE